MFLYFSLRSFFRLPVLERSILLGPGQVAGIRLANG